MSEVEEHRRYVQSQRALNRMQNPSAKSAQKSNKGLDFDIPTPYLPVSKYDLDRLNVKFDKYKKNREMQVKSAGKQRKKVKEAVERAETVSVVAGKMWKIYKVNQEKDYLLK